MPQAAAVPGLSRLPDVHHHLSRLTLAPDLSPADWIVASLTTFGESVLSLVPLGFESYVRLFHHGHRRDGSHVPWAEIAAAYGKQPHAGMQLGALTNRDEYSTLLDDSVIPPQTGSLPRSLIPPLVDVLAHHTRSAGRCWFAVWHGFGDLRSELRAAPTFATPRREYHLASGPLEAVVESLSEVPWGHRSPSIWWPGDRAWCVATEVDLRTTYIGCSDTCRYDLLARPELEAYEIDPSIGVDWQSDRINRDSK